MGWLKLDVYKWFVLFGACLNNMLSYGLVVATAGMMGVYFEQKFGERELSYIIGNITFAMSLLPGKSAILLTGNFQVGNVTRFSKYIYELFLLPFMLHIINNPCTGSCNLLPNGEPLLELRSVQATNSLRWMSLFIQHRLLIYNITSKELFMVFKPFKKP